MTCPHGFPKVANCIDCMDEVGIPVEHEHETVEFVFTAKFDGDCSGCNLPVHVGQRIARLSTGRYAHEGCAS